jgi:UDP-glucose 4,6-dehydratase
VARSGSHVVLLLVRKYPQYMVVNFDKLDYCSCLKNLESIKGAPNYKFVKGDLLSADLVNYVLQNEEIDTIMHFAAQSHVDNSFGNSIAFTESNILGTHVLLEGAKLCGAQIKLFVHVSTDEVYGDGSHGVASHEATILEPTNPYAATKAGAEYIVKAYYRSFRVPIIITRGNNVYGPHQYPEKIIPKFVNQIAAGRKLTLHGSGANTRNYLYVEDVARAFDVVLHRGRVGEIYNIGGTNELSNRRVAEEIVRRLTDAGRDLPTDKPLPAELLDRFIEHTVDRPFNDLRYPLDCSKLHELGWREEVAWEDGLARTVEWYLKFSGNWGDISSALVAHPRRGLTPGQIRGAGADDDAASDKRPEPLTPGLAVRLSATAEASPSSTPTTPTAAHRA